MPGVASDPQGNLYVSSPHLRAVTQLRPDGSFVRNIAAGQLTNPGAIAADASGNLFVVDDGQLIVIPALPVGSHPAAPSAVGKG